MPPFDKKPRQSTFLPCGAVAANRARRNAAKAQAPKVLLPLIATAVFIGLMIDRLQYTLTGFTHRWIPIGSRQAARNVLNAASSTKLDDFSIRTTDRGNRAIRPDGDDHRPSSEQIARLLAFMIRNKGRIDNAVSDKKWRDLDRQNMPLAVYLRQIEAESRWSELERDLKQSAREPSKSAKSGSKRDRDIITLIPEWSRRGEELLATLDAEDRSNDPQPTTNRPEDDDPPPKPKCG